MKIIILILVAIVGFCFGVAYGKSHPDCELPVVVEQVKGANGDFRAVCANGIIKDYRK